MYRILETMTSRIGPLQDSNASTVGFCKGNPHIKTGFDSLPLLPRLGTVSISPCILQDASQALRYYLLVTKILQISSLMVTAGGHLGTGPIR